MSEALHSIDGEQRFQRKELNPSIEVQESDTIKQIRERMEAIGKQEGLEESLSFIKTLSEPEQKYILGAFSEFKIKAYVKNNGLPNSETYTKFKESFRGEDVKQREEVGQKKEEVGQKKEEVGQKKEEIGQKKEEQVGEKILENINQLKTISSTLSNYKSDVLKSGVSQDFLDSLEKAVKGDKQEYEKIKKEILGNNRTLEKILKAFLEIDKKNAAQGKPTQLFKEIAANFSSFDPSLNARIEKFKLENDVGTLQTAQINATLGINSDKQYAGDFVYNKDRVAVDLSKNPPEAFMSSEGGYKLPLDMPVGEFYPATVKYEKARQNLEPQITTLNSAGPILQKAYEDTKGAESQEDKNAVISNLKLQLKGKLGNVYDDLNLDNKTSIKDIVDTIRAKRDALQRDLTQAYTDYQTDLKRISEVYAKSQQERKEIMKSSLDFISSIGFDVVPQYITDMILGEINRGEHGPLISEPIDIANGNFGIKNADKKRIITDEKQAFIKLINKMFSGNEKEPIGILEHSGETNIPIDKMKLKEQLARYGVFPNKEKWDINKIRENLRKKPVSDTSKNPS